MPLNGKRLLITRGEAQAAEFADLIRGRGGVPVIFPTVKIVAADDPGPIRDAVRNLTSFDWVLFASANAVRFFMDHAMGAAPLVLIDRLRVGSVGPGTTRAASEAGVTVFLEAGTYTAEGLLEALEREGISGKRFLVPRASEGREVLVEGSKAKGCFVTAPAVYRNGLPEKDEAVAAEIISDPPYVCTFASPSAFRNFFELMGEEGARSVLSRSRIAVIGEVTARAVVKDGWKVDFMPRRFTLPGMLDSVEEHLRDTEGVTR